MVSVKVAGAAGLLLSIGLVAIVVLVVAFIRFSSASSDLRVVFETFANEAVLSGQVRLETQLNGYAERLLVLSVDESFDFFTHGLLEGVNGTRFVRSLIENQGYDLTTAAGVAAASRFATPHVFNIHDEYAVNALVVGAPAPALTGGTSLTVARIGLLPIIRDMFVSLLNLSRVDPTYAGYDTSFPMPPSSKPGFDAFMSRVHVTFVNSNEHHLLAALPTPVGIPSEVPAHVKRLLDVSAFGAFISEGTYDMAPVPGTTCPWASYAGSLYVDANGTCFGTPSTAELSRILEPCIGAPQSRGCHMRIGLPYDSTSYWRYPYGPMLMLRVSFPVVNLTLTHAAVNYSRSANHGKGLGLAERAGTTYNAYGQCSVANPCTTPMIPAGANPLMRPIYDDFLGAVDAYIPMNHLAFHLKDLTTRRTASMRAAMSRTAIERVAELGLADENMRVFIVDGTGFLLATSTGASPLVSNAVVNLNAARLADGVTTDPVAVAICGSLSQMAEASGGGVPCGLDRVYPRLARNGAAPPEDIDFTTIIGTSRSVSSNATWRVLVSLRDMPLGTCDTLTTTCVESVWMIVAIPEWDLMHASQETVAAFAKRQADEIDAVGRAVDKAFSTAIIILIAVAAAVVLLAAVIGAVFFVWLMIPIGRISELVWGTSTLDLDVLHAVLADAGVTVPDSLLETDDANEGDTDRMQDIREELMMIAIKAVRPSKTSAAELTALGNGASRLLQTIVSLMKYVPEDVALMYAQSGTVARLGVREVDAVVLSSDVVEFTAFCERTPLAAVLSVMGRYFGAMCDCVHVTGGTIDKFVGDAIVATWGAISDHTHPYVGAVTSGVNMLGTVEQRADRFKGLKIRVGVDTGPALMGNIGTVRRFIHTVIGDCVDGAEQLEGKCKDLDCRMLISDQVISKEPDVAMLFPLRPVARRTDLYNKGEWLWECFYGEKLLPLAIKAGHMKNAISCAVKAPPGGSTTFDDGTTSNPLSPTASASRLRESGARPFSIDAGPMRISQAASFHMDSSGIGVVGGVRNSVSSPPAAMPRGSGMGHHIDRFGGGVGSGVGLGALRVSRPSASFKTGSISYDAGPNTPGYGSNSDSNAGTSARGGGGKALSRPRARLFNILSVYSSPPAQLLTSAECSAVDLLSDAVKAYDDNAYDVARAKLTQLRPLMEAGVLPPNAANHALHMLTSLEKQV